VKKHTFRVAAALVGASAVITMGVLSAAAGATQVGATSTVVPEHFGGPVNTSVFSPSSATVGVPTSTSAAATAG
jgi:hypothetical protein